MLKSILRIFTWWDGQTLNTQFWSWRNGVKIGEDGDGNRFYENRDGSRRWVIYNGKQKRAVCPQNGTAGCTKPIRIRRQNRLCPVKRGKKITKKT